MAGRIDLGGRRDSSERGRRVGVRGSAIAGVGVVAYLLMLTACSQTTAVPSTSASPQVVKVTAGNNGCGPQPAVVSPGVIMITATNTANAVRIITLYGPESGRYTKVLGRIPTLAPGQQQSTLVTMDLGAFEIACEDLAGQSVRARLTVA